MGTYIVKELCISGVWETINSLFVKNDNALWPILSKNGKMWDKTAASSILKMHFRFHEPEKARQFNADSLLCVRDKYADFDKVFGCWPFDFIDVVRFPTDMEKLYKEYYISGIRAICWRDK